MKAKNLNSSLNKTKSGKDFNLKKNLNSISSLKLKKNLTQTKSESKQIEFFQKQEKEDPNELKLKFIDDATFDIEKFMKTHTDEALRCKICEKLIKDGLSCYKCNLTFCGQCIKNELETHNKCPACYNIIFLEMLIPVDIQSKEYYKSKELICPYDRCKQLLNLSNARSHLEECIFNKVSNEKRQHITKIIFLEDKTDPFLKTHTLNYLIECNKKMCSDIDFSKTENNFKMSNFSNFSKSHDQVTVNVPHLIPRLNDLNLILRNNNEYLTNIMVDLARTTKNTNEKLKNMINC
jgi:hypothetical protein